MISQSSVIALENGEFFALRHVFFMASFIPTLHFQSSYCCTKELIKKTPKSNNGFD